MRGPGGGLEGGEGEGVWMMCWMIGRNIGRHWEWKQNDSASRCVTEMLHTSLPKLYELLFCLLLVEVLAPYPYGSDPHSASSA